RRRHRRAPSRRRWATRQDDTENLMDTARLIIDETPGTEVRARRLPLVQARATGPARISVVIATLNEAANLPYVFDRLPQIHELIVVDGGSSDGTPEVARALW